MNRHAMVGTALALVSLGAACTPLNPVSGTASASGATSAAAATPFTPYEPSPAPAEAMAPAMAGATGTAPAVPVAPPRFQPDLNGITTSATVTPRPVSGGTLLVLASGDVAVASDPDRDRVYVVDLRARAVRSTLELSAGDEPGRLVEDAAGNVHVALRRGGAVVTFDPTTGLVMARQDVCTAPRGLAYDAGQDLVHVACADGQLVSLRAAGGVVRTLALSRDLRDVVVTKTGALVVSTFRSASVTVIDAKGVVGASLLPPTRRGASSVGALRLLSPSVAWRLAPAGDAGVVMLHQRGVDDEVDPVAGGYAGVNGCGAIVESATTVIAPDGTMAISPGLGMVTLAVDVAVSPDGQQVALAAPGNARTTLPQVVVAPLAMVSSGDADCLPLSPPPVAVTDGAVGPIGAPSGHVVAVAYAADGTLVAQSREPATLWTADGRGSISLSDESTGNLGHEIFHVDAGGGIACASCHPEGGDDGRVWSFAGLRPAAHAVGARRAVRHRAVPLGRRHAGFLDARPGGVRGPHVGAAALERPDLGAPALARRPSRAAESRARRRSGGRPRTGSLPERGARLHGLSRGPAPHQQHHGRRRHGRSVPGAVLARRRVARAVPARGVRADAGRSLRCLRRGGQTRSHVAARAVRHLGLDGVPADALKDARATSRESSTRPEARFIPTTKGNAARPRRGLEESS